MPGIYDKNNKKIRNFLGKVSESAVGKKEPSSFSKLRSMFSNTEEKKEEMPEIEPQKARELQKYQLEREKLRKQEEEAERRRAQEGFKTGGEAATDFIKRLRRSR